MVRWKLLALLIQILNRESLRRCVHQVVDLGVDVQFLVCLFFELASRVDVNSTFGLVESKNMFAVGIDHLRLIVILKVGVLNAPAYLAELGNGALGLHEVWVLGVSHFLIDRTTYRDFVLVFTGVFKFFHVLHDAAVLHLGGLNGYLRRPDQAIDILVLNVINQNGLRRLDLVVPSSLVTAQI